MSTVTFNEASSPVRHTRGRVRADPHSAWSASFGPGQLDALTKQLEDRAILQAETDAVHRPQNEFDLRNPFDATVLSIYQHAVDEKGIPLQRLLTRGDCKSVGRYCITDPETCKLETFWKEQLATHFNLSEKKPLPFPTWSARVNFILLCKYKVDLAAARTPLQERVIVNSIDTISRRSVDFNYLFRCFSDETPPYGVNLSSSCQVVGVDTVKLLVAVSVEFESGQRAEQAPWDTRTFNRFNAGIAFGQWEGYQFDTPRHFCITLSRTTRTARFSINDDAEDFDPEWSSDLLGCLALDYDAPFNAEHVQQRIQELSNLNDMPRNHHFTVGKPPIADYQREFESIARVKHAVLHFLNDTAEGRRAMDRLCFALDPDGFRYVNPAAPDEERQIEIPNEVHDLNKSLFMQLLNLPDLMWLWSPSSPTDSLMQERLGSVLGNVMQSTKDMIEEMVVSTRDKIDDIVQRLVETPTVFNWQQRRRVEIKLHTKTYFSEGPVQAGPRTSLYMPRSTCTISCSRLCDNYKQKRFNGPKGPEVRWSHWNGHLDTDIQFDDNGVWVKQHERVVWVKQHYNTHASQHIEVIPDDPSNAGFFKTILERQILQLVTDAINKMRDPGHDRRLLELHVERSVLDNDV